MDEKCSTLCSLLMVHKFAILAEEKDFEEILENKEPQFYIQKQIDG